MATKSRNGLEQAMILLMQNQAAFQSQLLAMNERFARMEERLDKEFAEIKAILRHHEEILMRHEQILLDHERLLQALPDVIRQKIGFKARQ